MTRAELFAGTGVKRYALRYRKDAWSPWEYPSGMEFDTAEEARAALEGLSSSYQAVEKYPSLKYGPVGYGGSRSKLLDNLLIASGQKPYKLQRRDVLGSWLYCNDLQFDTLKDAQAACLSRGDEYQVIKAMLDIRYEPVGA